MVAQHLKPGMWFKARDEVGDGAFRRLAQKVDLELLARLAKSDCLGREPGQFNCEAMDWFLDRARALGVEHRPPDPILLGRHLLALGLAPGPKMGAILRAVYELQLDGTVGSLDEAIGRGEAIDLGLSVVSVLPSGPFGRSGGRLGLAVSDSMRGDGGDDGTSLADGVTVRIQHREETTMKSFSMRAVTAACLAAGFGSRIRDRPDIRGVG